MNKREKIGLFLIVVPHTDTKTQDQKKDLKHNLEVQHNLRSTVLQTSFISSKSKVNMIIG